jgi:hypothetical protein
MNKKYYSALICGFGASVILTFPGSKNFACCLFIPLAAAVSIYLFRRSTHSIDKMETGMGILLGLITGIFAAVFSTGFDLLITYLTKSNELVQNFPEVEALINKMNLGESAANAISLIKEMTNAIRQNGFSIIFAVMILVSNLISYAIFGLVGGAVATAIINSRVKNSQ